MKYIALSSLGWGVGSTVLLAARNERLGRPRATPTGTRRKQPASPPKYYRCHSDTKVHGDGSWTYPQGEAPVEVDSLGNVLEQFPKVQIPLNPNDRTDLQP